MIKEERDKWKYVFVDRYLCDRRTLWKECPYTLRETPVRSIEESSDIARTRDIIAAFGEISRVDMISRDIFGKESKEPYICES